jgi:hypothetical protein
MKRKSYKKNILANAGQIIYFLHLSGQDVFYTKFGDRIFFKKET